MTVMDTATRRLTGAQIVVEYLVRQGVPCVAGIPGHGCWALTDALLDRRDAIRTVQVMHEQSAVHLADGFYRATGRPMLAFTSIGPGATNTVVGMATAYVDSTAVALADRLAAHVHARRRPAPGARATARRRQPADLRAGRQGVVAAVARRRAAVRPPPGLERDGLRAARARSSSTSRWTSRPTAAEVRLPDPALREARGRIRPAADDIERAAALLREAKRPVIVAGGGVITAEASAELTALAERLGAPVVTTWNGKGAIDETHDARRADDRRHRVVVAATSCRPRPTCILSVGNRFTDWSASSYRAGVTFAIPPTKLIQLDIDPREIGKNYPVDGRRSSATRRPASTDLLAALGPGGGRRGLPRDTVLRRDPAAQGGLVRAGRDQVRLGPPRR